MLLVPIFTDFPIVLVSFVIKSEVEA